MLDGPSDGFVNPDQRLSDTGTTAARISMAQPSSGDMFGVVEAAKVGSQGARPVIDEVQP